MVNKKLWLGALIIALVFGMTVVGCEEEEEKDDNPSPPTGLAASNVLSTSVQLTWDSVSNASEYWIDYSETDGFRYGGGHREGITSTSYTITDLVSATKYDFKVAVKNTDGAVSSYSSTITVETLPPLTGSISLSYLRTTGRYLSTGVSGYYYTVLINLKLSKGAYWNSVPASNTAKTWVTVTGLTLSSWSFSVGTNEDTLTFSYTSDRQASQISIASGMTVSIDTSKFTEMKG